jgi:cobalt-zinc-cadmium efflux system membrane fusion protein
MSIFLGSLSFFISSCTSNSDSSSEAEAVATENTIEAVEVTQKQFNSSAMELGKIETKAFSEVVKANGMFDVPPENNASVSSYFGGTVKNIKLLPGEKVRKGQVLFVLENPDFVQLQQEYLEAKSQLQYLQSDYKRQKNLVKDSVTSKKNFLKAQADYQMTKVKVESFAKKLMLMNLSPSNLTDENMRSSISILSPIDGYITKINVHLGDFLNPAETAISLVNTDHQHLEINIFEKDLSKVQIGQKIRFKVQNNLETEYEATVHLVNKTIDPVNRTIGVHGHLVNEELNDRFTPGMYLEAKIQTSSDSGLALPEGAVVEMENQYFVLQLEEATDEGYTFTKKEVNLGSRSNGNVQILNAETFKVDDQFLTKGAFDLILD